MSNRIALLQLFLIGIGSLPVVAAVPVESKSSNEPVDLFVDWDGVGRGRHISVGDVNQDGMADVVTSFRTGKAIVYTQCESKEKDYVEFIIPRILTIGEARDHRLGDINNDGRLELICTYSNQPTMALSVDPKNPCKKRITSRVNGPFDVIVCDLNQDGLDDVIETGKDAAAYIYYQTEDATFSEVELKDDRDTVRRISFLPLCVAVGDLNQDGKTDVVVGGFPTIVAFEQAEEGSFRFKPILEVDIENIQKTGGLDKFDISDIEIVDWTSDGIPDLIYATMDGIFLIEGAGGGNFEPPVLLKSVIFTPRCVLKKADFDADGMDEIVFSSLKDRYILRKAGKGEYRTYRLHGYDADNFVIADMNADGVDDVVFEGGQYFLGDRGLFDGKK